MQNTINDSFEKEFMSIKLATQIKHCSHNELVPLFQTYLKGREPILEAGCGSGQWVGWFSKQGWKSTGLDWSQKLCQRARKELPDCNFICGDLQCMPLKNAEFGSIIALGSIEHTTTGPEKIFEEFHRVLRADGIAIITVPYGGFVRRCIRFLFKPFDWLKSASWMRKVFNKKGWQGKSLREAKKETVQEWHPRFSCEKEGWAFFEYEFNKKQMRGFFRQTRFQIIREYVAAKDSGIYHNFGGPFSRNFTGRFNKQAAKFEFNWVGRLLKKILPVSWVGHMLHYVVKPQHIDN
jgi:SAM-dependent methyltransferase